MIIHILCTESLGARGLSCWVELKDRKIFIDPGIALGWSRYGFLPHPFQIAIGAQLKAQIIDQLQDTSDVIISHFDGDHCPLHDANPYQLSLHDVTHSLSKRRIWAKGPLQSPPVQQKRRESLAQALPVPLIDAEGLKSGPFQFSCAVPHGPQERTAHTIMMSRIEEDGFVFVHASDSQLLDGRTIDTLLDWQPDLVLVSGPPLYRYAAETCRLQRDLAWEHALKLSMHVDTLIVDHHLLRSEEGLQWLRQLRRESKNEVLCAADFMHREPLLLEAWRKELYEWLPVPDGWHEAYARGEAGWTDYWSRGWQALIGHGKIKAVPPT